MVLMVLEVVLVVLEVVLVVLEVTGPQVPWGVFQIRLSLRPDLYSPAPPIPTGTILRPIAANILGHILGTKPTKNIGV